MSSPLVRSTSVALLLVLVAGCSSSGPTAETAETADIAEAAERADVAETAETADIAETPVSSAVVEEQAESSTVRIEYGTATDQFGDLWLPAASPDGDLAPVVVLVHGGFWRQQFDLTLMDPLAADLVERGYASWNIEYARVGGAGGWPETGDDVAAAIDELAVIAADYPIDVGRVVLVGHSAGGHLALWSLGRADAALEPVGAVGLGAVVDLASFGESVGLLGGTIGEVPDVYADAAPVLDPGRVVLVQGEADGIVPTASLGVAAAAGVRIESIPGNDHFDLIDPASESWATTIELLDEL